MDRLLLRRRLEGVRGHSRVTMNNIRLSVRRSVRPGSDDTRRDYYQCVHVLTYPRHTSVGGDATIIQGDAMLVGQLPFTWRHRCESIASRHISHRFHFYTRRALRIVCK